MYRIDGEYILKTRRELHRVPEIGFDLEKTLSIVERELKNLGIEYTKEYGISSILAKITPKSYTKTIALRADLDALPITEKTDLPFSSLHTGVMHACGHDCHTAMLLGTAKALKEMENKLPCRIKLIFQAAEETDGGAELLCNDGAMSEVDEILACHVAPEISTGKIALKSGITNASANPFNIHFYGKKSHIAKPHLGTDALLMANDVYSEIRALENKLSKSGKKILIGIGEMQGGSARNIISDNAVIKGTLRALDERIRKATLDGIQSICKTAQAKHGGEIKIEFLPSYPAVRNDAALCEKIRKISMQSYGFDSVQEKRESFGAEDFSFYQEKARGLIFDLGVKKEGDDFYPLHSEKFNPDEYALTIAPKIFLEYILSQ